MGLADFKARFFLFFARKLREWANSIDENAPSRPPQPASSTVEGRGSEPVTEFDDDALGSGPSNQLFTRVRTGPPQHWVDLVRERAPELLSLSQEYSLEEDTFPEDPVHTDQSLDDEIEIPRPRAVDVPTDKEDVVRKSGPVSLPPTRGVDKRNARKLTRVKSSPPRPLTLKPLSEPNPFLQPPIHGGAQRTEPAKPPQLIEVLNQQKKTVTPHPSSSGAINKEDQLTTSELARQPKPQARRSDKAPVIYRTTKTEGTMVSQTKGPGELDVTRKSDGQRRVVDAVGKAESGPRRYWQAIVSVTKKTLRRTGRTEGQPPYAITPINLSVKSSKDSSSTAKVILVGEPSKSQLPVKQETSSTSIRQHSEKKTAMVGYARLKEKGNRVTGNGERKLLPPRPKASIKNVKTASRQTAPAAFPRPVNRFADASNARIQDSFVQMPALIDEEKMNRASSVHLADLRPGKNQWPDLPSATSTEMADELAAHQRDLNRMRRLKQEQRGTPWNE